MKPAALRAPASAVSLAAAVLTAAAVLLPAPATATTARLLGLGGQGDYLEDQANVVSWYGSLLDYPDLVVLELGSYRYEPYDQGAGLHWRLDESGDWGTLGVYLLGDPERDGEQERFMAMWGRAFGPLAAVLTFSGSSFSRSRGDQYERDFRHQLGAGTRVQLGPRLYADVAAEALGTDFATVGPADTLGGGGDGWSWDGFGARARLFWGPSERVALIPLYSHLENDRGTHDWYWDIAGDLDERLDRVGLGVNLLPDPDRLVVLSVEYEDGRQHYLATHRPTRYDWLDRDWWSIAGRFALEARVLSWLSVRGGARYRRLEETLRLGLPADPEADPPLPATTWPEGHVDADIEVDLGLGLHLGRFAADFVFNDKALFNFGGLLTNSGQDDRFEAQFTRVSLLYSF